ncbi:carbonic anhydrase [Limnobacter sp.]|uniref:carbonic anhydrase n=1 Tax=Limnobacter sp. TaxID=2003368 RepID=UPI00351715D3
MIHSPPQPYSETRLQDMLARNAQWAQQISALDPDYFKRLSAGQSPAFTVISCCDSRTDPNTLLQSNLGELFVYKNVANQAGLNDLSLQTALQFSIDSLQVQHLLVLGHHSCGGIRMAMGLHAGGAPGDWLEGVRTLAHHHQLLGADSPTLAARRVDQLAELNVIQQVRQAALSPAVNAAWGRGQAVAISGLIYSMSTGQVLDLNCTIRQREEIDERCFAAMKAINQRYA